jgi:hypothetical protein
MAPERGARRGSNWSGCGTDSNWSGRGNWRGSGPGLLQQEDRVQNEQDPEYDGPAIEVALHHRSAAQRACAAADAEGSRQTGVFTRVHEHQEDQHNGDDDLHNREDRFHVLKVIGKAEIWGGLVSDS